MPGMSYDQLMRVPQIARLYEQLHTPASFFQRYFKLAPTDTPVIASQQRVFGYDLVANTRTLAPMTAPMAPPVSVGQKPVGTAMAAVFRTNIKTTIADEKVFMTRQLGSFGLNTKVDATGQRYIAMQMKHLKTQVTNSVEWMVAKMFQGGFGIKQDGEAFRLCELTDANAIHKNEYLIPASNKGDLGGIIGAGEAWNDPAAPILDHLNEISVQAARVSGYQPTDIIMNGNTGKHLFNNTQLAKVGGTAYRIFDSLTNREVRGDEPPTSGPYTVQFRALPQYNFHIYNEGLVLNNVVPDYNNQVSTNNWSALIPDGYALIVPPPGDWVGFGTCMEPVAENVMSEVKTVTGLYQWRTREIDPPRFDIKMLLNYVPILPQPQAVIWANVWRTGL
jgi:hypothetical protein